MSVVCWQMIHMKYAAIFSWKSRKLSQNLCLLIGARTLSLLVSSADNLSKQSEPRSGPTKCRAWSVSKLFDTLMVFLKEFFEKVDFEKN